MNQQTQRGIEALKAGDRAAARQLLSEAVRQNPADSAAWLWLSGAVGSDAERVACLQRVLRLDPHNQHAARGLEKIMARRAQAAGTAPPEQSAADKIQPAADNIQPAADNIQPADQADDAAGQLSEPDIQLSDPVVLVTPAPEDQAVDVEEAPAAQEWESAADEIQPAADKIQPAEDDIQPAEALPPIVPLDQPRAPRTGSVLPAADAGERVFRTRPSQVLALLAFWTFFFGAIVVSQLLQGVGAGSLPLAALLGGLLEIVVIYAVVRNFRTQYELTSQQLSLPYQGRRVSVPVTDLLHADKQQNFVQGLLGTGDLIIDAVLGGKLTHLRLRDVPDVQLRLKDLHKTIKSGA